MAAWHLFPAALAHAELLAVVHGRCFEETWSRRVIAELLSTPGGFAYMAVVDDPVVGEAPAGFTLARIASDDAELLTLCVLPAYRRQGIAASLLDMAIRRARELSAGRLFLEVAETNEPARALYANRGFAAGRRRPDYYRAPNRAPVAALELKCDLSRDPTRA
ncbi:MAG TPA: GNAT family N-acetyltransferase [Alphaproteobacteria bacterium]